MYCTTGREGEAEGVSILGMAGERDSVLGMAGGDSGMISGSESRSESRGSQGNERSVDGPRPKRLLGKHSICNMKYGRKNLHLFLLREN